VPVRAHEPDGESTRPWNTTEIPEARIVPRPYPPGGHVDATDATITGLYGTHYRFLVRIAVLLGHDGATAEEVVQDSFAATCADMHHARNTEEAVSYLLAAVISSLGGRHQLVTLGTSPQRCRPELSQSSTGHADR
jgi:hypothetical protein